MVGAVRKGIVKAEVTANVVRRRGLRRSGIAAVVALAGSCEGMRRARSDVGELAKVRIEVREACSPTLCMLHEANGRRADWNSMLTILRVVGWSRDRCKAKYQTES